MVLYADTERSRINKTTSGCEPDPYIFSSRTYFGIRYGIKELKSFQNGSLYALELDQLNVTDPFDQFALGREYLGYYYVTSEDIYYMPSDTGGYTEEKNEIIISGLESDEDLFLKEWTIVCCENGTADVVDDAGYHAFVEADGEKRIFRYYNDYFYGSKDYLLMVWEKGKGIVYYMHGNGQKNACGIWNRLEKTAERRLWVSI